MEGGVPVEYGGEIDDERTQSRGGLPGISPGRSRAAGTWVPHCGTWTVTDPSPEPWG